jgi:hypothetical protein
MATDVPISRTVPTEYSTPLTAFQIRFDEMPAPTGIAPALPNGTSGITDQMAVEIAGRQSGLVAEGKLLPGVQVAARFGAFSSDVLSRHRPGEPAKLLYQDRPAWLVTFSRAPPGKIYNQSHGPCATVAWGRFCNRIRHVLSAQPAG